MTVETQPEGEIVQAIAGDEPVLELGSLPISASDIEVRDLARRELDIRLVPWNTVIDTVIGLEEFRRGAFADSKPEDVLLHGLEHEAFFGLGQNGTPRLTRHPVGRAISLDDKPDGQYATFRVAKTARGDEVLALAVEGIVRGASVEYAPLPGGTTVETHNGRRKSVHTRAQLNGASTTYRPAFEQAGVVAVRSSHQEEATSMAAETQAAAEAAAPAPQPAPQPAPEAPASESNVQTRSVDDAIAAFGQRMATSLEGFSQRFGDRLDAIEERNRSQFTVPGAPAQPDKPEVHGGNWLQYALRALSGDRISTEDAQYRALADIVTTDNLGVVPDTFAQDELIGVIDPARPFLSTTRRLPTPTSGMTLHVPKIVTRPTVGIQSEEKDELTSTPTQITSESFDAVTKGGAGDLSLQILKRSDPSFLDLYLRLLAEAYAMDSEAEAIEALLAETAVHEGGAIDVAEAQFGQAFVDAFDVVRRGPDTIWLSSAAVGAMIDAVHPVTGMPMYSSITADITVPGGISGTVKGLRPVHVPELGGQGVDILIGPSSGFAWAEDGTYTLQVDVPAKAGRDVALVGMLWFAPYYPGAFTSYTLES